MTITTNTVNGGRANPLGLAGKAMLLGAVGLVALGHAPPAGAAGSDRSPGVEWKSDGRTADDPFSGKVHLRADVTTDRPVDGWALTIVDRAQQPVFGTVCHDEFGSRRDRFSVDCRWDTRTFSDQRPSANGHYLVRLMTTDGQALQPAGPDREVTVTNTASAPADITVVYDEAAQRATLSWRPNPEPDVAHYDVEEKVGKGPWTRIGTPADPRFERVLTQPEEHRFRVAAERRDADGRPGGPGPWGAADSSVRASADGERPRRDDRAKPAPREPGKPAPAQHRTPTADAASPVPAPESDTAAGTPPATAPAGARPQDQAARSFSPSSAEAPSSGAGRTGRGVLDGTAPPRLAGVSSRPAAQANPAASTAPPPAALEYDDTVFQAALPYPDPQPGDSLEEDEAAAAVPPFAPPSEALGPGRSNTGRRVVGLSLVAAAAGLLMLARRPAHRRRGVTATKRRRARPVRTVASGDVQVALERLEARVSCLESAGTERAGDRRVGSNRCSARPAG